VRSNNFGEWTREELIETIGVLRRENASLQREISKFLTGKAFVVPPIVPRPLSHSNLVPRPGEWPNRQRLPNLTKRCG
jgi:hypothetical protein